MGQTREQKILKQCGVPTVQKRTPVASDMFLPNHSGIATHPEFISHTYWDLDGNKLIPKDSTKEIYVHENITTGASGAGDDRTAGEFTLTFNQDSATIGDSRALRGNIYQEQGAIFGVCIGNTTYLELNGGSVIQWVRGYTSRIDQAAGHTIGGNVHGMYLRVNCEGTVTGDVYLLEMKEDTGVDWAIYHNGTAPSHLGGKVEVASLEINSTTEINSIKDEDNMASDSETALCTQQSIKAYVDSNSSYATYDVIVASDGSGDYTSIATAFSTEGDGKRYYITGTFAESANIVVPGTSSFYFDNVTVNFSSNYYMYFTAKSDTFAHGSLVLNGDGDTAWTRLFYIDSNSNNNDWSNCRIKIEPTDTTPGAKPQYYALVYGEHNRTKFFLKDISITGTAGQNMFGVGINGTRCTTEVILDTITDATSRNIYGVVDSGFQNVTRIQIDAVTTTAGNGGRGVLLQGTYGFVTGCSRNCDAANSAIGGTGNVGHLAT